jgi:protein-tyrosine-phosphatase
VTQPRDGEAKAPFTILVVCSGNTCRSPFGEGLLRLLAAEHLRTPVQIFSAGTSAVAGALVSRNAQLAAQEHGVDLAGKSATPLTADLALRADLILAMESSHARTVAALAPSAAEKTLLVGRLAPGAGAGEIADPFGGALDAYRRCFAEMSALLREGLPLIAERADRHAARPGRDPA